MTGSQASAKTGIDFGKGDVGRLILGQAIPLTLAQLVQLLYNIVDRIYIGHLNEVDNGNALSGLGVCFPIITIVSAFVNWISAGASPLCSMARGRKEQKKAQDILTTAFAFQVIDSLALTVIVLLAKKPLLYLLGASDATYGYASEYLNVYMLGTVFFALGTGMNNFINLQGFPKKGMMTILIGSIVNLILDPIFIFALDLGVKGAAIATVISQFCSAVWVFAFLSNRDRELRINLSDFKIHLSVAGEILTLGLPGFIVGATNSAVQSVCNATLSQFGGDLYIGIMTIINSVREVIGLPISGITGGSQPVLSFNYGAKKYDRVSKGIRFASLIGLAYTAVFWLFTLLFPGFFLHIFSKDAEVVAAGLTPLRIYFMGFIFMSLQFAGQSTFTALGKAKHAIFFSIFRKIIIVVPLTILLPGIPALGVMGVFWAEPISNLIGGLASFLCMYFTVYRKLVKEERKINVRTEENH